jgi:hypothetical protein
MDEEVEPVDELESIPAMLWPDVPRLGFGAGYERRLDADVEWGQRFGMFGYVEGYRRAAAAVFAAAADQNPGYSVWPLAFLWRHHLELAMKDIIAAGRQIEGHDGGFPKGHDLLKLWREARPHIERCGPKDSPELRNVEANIVEFQKIDPGGDGFRYPMKSDLRGRSLPDAPAHVNLATLHEAMEAVASFFSAVRTELGARLDYISEARREESLRDRDEY